MKYAVTVTEAAEILGKTKASVRCLIRSGRLICAGKNCEGHLLIHKNSVEELANSLTERKMERQKALHDILNTCCPDYDKAQIYKKLLKKSYHLFTELTSVQENSVIEDLMTEIEDELGLTNKEIINAK